MKKIICSILTCSFCIYSFLYAASQPEKIKNSRNHNMHTISVSIAPLAFFAKQITNNTPIQVTSVLTGIDNPEFFDPQPHDIQELYNSDIYYFIGTLPFEKKLRTILNEQKTISVQLAPQNILQHWDSHVYNATEHDASHTHEQYDIHVWLGISPLLTMLSRMTHDLQMRYPQYAKNFSAAMTTITQELTTLNRQTQTKLKPYKNTMVLTEHPSYGYALAPYGILQLSIENDGSEITIQELEQLLQTAETNKIQVLFTNPQYTYGIVQTIAQTLDISITEINIVQENWFTSFHAIVNALTTQHQNE